MRVLIPFVCLLITANGVISPRAVGQQTDPPQPEEVVRDEFRSEPPAGLETAGDVSWQPGSITLAEAAAVTWPLNGSSRVDVELTVDELGAVPDTEGTAAEGTAAELLFEFLLNESTRGVVRLREETGDSGIPEASIAMLTVVEQDGDVTERPVRVQPLRSGGQDSLSISFRHGLVQVFSGDTRLLAAHAEFDSYDVAAFRVRVVSGTATLSRIAVRRTPVLPEPTAAQQEQLAEADAAMAEEFALYRQGRFADAAAVRERVLGIHRRVLGPWHPQSVESLHNLSFLYGNAGDSARAEPLCRESLQRAKALLGEWHPDYARILSNLAGIYGDMGDYARAEPLYVQAQEIRRVVRGETHPEFAYTLSNMATMYYNVGDNARAAELSTQATDIYRSALGTQHPLYGLSLSNLASVIHRQGDLARAETLYRECVAVLKDSLGEQHPDYALSLSTLAYLCRTTDRFAESEELYRQAADINRSILGDQHPEYATSLSDLVSLYQQTGDYAQAEELGRQALRIMQSSRDRNAVVQSARQQRRNQAKLRSFLDLCLVNALELQRPADTLLSDVWQWKGAVTTRQQAYRKVASNPDLAPLFEQLQAASRQLSALSDQYPRPLGDAADDAEQAELRQRRQDWEARFAAINDERERLEQQIAAGSDEFRRIRDPLTLTDVRAALPGGTALVEFVEYHRRNLPSSEQDDDTDGEWRYLVFVIRSDRDPAMIGLGSWKDVSRLIEAFRRPLQSGAPAVDAEQFVAAGQELRRLLWQPVESHLEGIDTVVISPDSELGTLPFAALPGRQPNTFLLEDYRMPMLPMAPLLRAMSPDTSRETDHRLLMVGDVDYDADPDQSSADTEPLLLAQARGLRSQQSSWSSLSGFREELDAVQNLHQQVFRSNGAVTILDGRRATEQSFLQQALRHNVLHIVTHGYFEDPEFASTRQADSGAGTAFRGLMTSSGPERFFNRYPPGLLSGLVLAGANNPAEDPEDPRDGILRASEIEASSLQGVELVVLSACETGLGAVAGGEGLTGLQRAFHVAGARSVIASLWKVDDRATQELMRRFYENLWQKKMSRIDALREAQLWMLRHSQELEAMGVTGAATRGLGGSLKRVDPVTRPDSASRRTDPFFWAAFQLSGDWQ